MEKPNSIHVSKSEECQSTGARNDSDQTEPNPSENKSKKFMSKIKRFFNF